MSGVGQLHIRTCVSSFAVRKPLSPDPEATLKACLSFSRSLVYRQTWRPKYRLHDTVFRFLSSFFRFFGLEKLSSHCDNMVMAPRETNSKKNEISNSEKRKNDEKIAKSKSRKSENSMNQPQSLGWTLVFFANVKRASRDLTRAWPGSQPNAIDRGGGGV